MNCGPGWPTAGGRPAPGAMDRDGFDALRAPADLLEEALVARIALEIQTRTPQSRGRRSKETYTARYRKDADHDVEWRQLNQSSCFPRA